MGVWSKVQRPAFPFEGQYTKRTFEGYLRCSVYLILSSGHCLYWAKMMRAHETISIPLWNCLPLMSHTPFSGWACTRFCRKEVGCFKRRSNIIVCTAKTPLLYGMIFPIWNHRLPIPCMHVTHYGVRFCKFVPYGNTNFNHNWTSLYSIHPHTPLLIEPQWSNWSTIISTPRSSET